MPQFADCTIGIRLSETGNILEEYGTQVVDRTVTSWVACESGKEFEITFKATSYPCSLQLVIYVDGIELVNRGYDHHRNMGHEIVCKGISMNAETVRPFVFSDIVFPEGDAAFDHNGLGDVGTIRIEVLQVVFTESRHPKYLVPSLLNDPSSRCSVIHGARGVRLGEQKVFRTKKMTSMPYDSSNPGPVAIFKYIYRPRAMLLSQGIIPTYVPRFVEHLDRGPGAGHGTSGDEPEPVDLESPYSPSIRSISSPPLPVDPPPLGRGSPGATPRMGMGFGAGLGSPRREGGGGREAAIRRLKEKQERINRELRELEEMRRLREQREEIERELEELERFPGE